MAGSQFNEKKFAKSFDYLDADFAENPAIVRRRKRVLDQLQSDAEHKMVRAHRHLQSERSLYKERFMYRLMAKDHLDWLSLNAAQRIDLYKHALQFAMVQQGKMESPLPLEWGAFWLELHATQVPEFAQHFHVLCEQCLKTGKFVTLIHGDQRSFSSDQKLLVFALEMHAATQDETIDWDSFGIPADRFWLDCARRGLTEPDTALAAQWVKDLCDAHMEAANTKGDTGGTDVLLGNEIDQEAHFLWPITVHAFLRLRRGLRLPDPDPIDHPLLRTSFAPLLNTKPGPERWNAEPWFVEIVETTLRELPELEAAKNLVL